MEGVGGIRNKRRRIGRDGKRKEGRKGKLGRNGVGRLEPRLILRV